MVLKLQRSISSSPGFPAQMLIYNEDRSIVFQSALTPEVREFMGNKLKMYIIGRIDKKGQVVIEKETTERNW